MRAIVFAVSILAAAPSMAATFNTPEVKGLANILALASKCEYAVSPEKLSAYLKAKGLDKPEALGWIKHKQAQEEGWAADATDADCAMARTTAEAIGILR